MTVPISVKLVFVCSLLLIFSIYFIISDKIEFRVIGLVLFLLGAYIFSKGYKRSDWW